MVGQTFINPALSSAIESYLKYKNKVDDPNFNSFLVMVIRSLVAIYSELDIINPYITHNESTMGGFDYNLAKYGFSENKIKDFKNLFMKYLEEEKQNKKNNEAFIQIEKYLIDMFWCKVTSTNQNNEEEIKKLLYLKDNTNQFVAEERTKSLINLDELDNYYASKKYELEHDFKLVEITRNILNLEAYQVLGYSMEQVNSLNDIDLRELNNRIYNFFMVDANMPNKEEMLEKAINYYKKYGKKVTSGNGYVDFILLLSIISTIVFVGILIFLS